MGGSLNGRRYVSDSEFVGMRRGAYLAEVSLTAIKGVQGTKRYRVLIRRAELVEFITSEKYDPSKRFRSDGYVRRARREEKLAEGKV